MIKFTFAVLCALLLLVGGTVLAQENPTGTPKGREHRTRKAGGTQSATFGDGSVHSLTKGAGTQSGASGLEAGRTHSIHGGWDQNRAYGTVATTQSKTGKKGARSLSKHPGGAN
jgi:hypothetical protein